MKGSQRPYLRLVGNASDIESKSVRTEGASNSDRRTQQPMLFSEASFQTLGFIKAGDLDADKFISLIREARPQVIFDLRAIPSFARRAVNRSAAFALFEEVGVKYFDVAGVLGTSGDRDGLLNPSLLINALQVNVLRHTKGLLGPVFFFVNNELFNDAYFAAVAERLPNQDGRGWDIACWPNEPANERPAERDLVFISHANPEDNEVALWLGSKLAASGYQVWSDVTRLVGGELFWDTIEDAIRRRASKVIVLLSRKGHEKPGVLDEVNVAIATERTERIDRFVIPVRIDDLPFSAIRANLSRKNVIDGHRNLSEALVKLLAILREDQVPLAIDASRASLNDLHVADIEGASGDQWNVLVENKITVLQWPRAIRRYRGSAKSVAFASHPVANGIVTFEDWHEIESALGEPLYRGAEAVFDPAESSSTLSVIFVDRIESRKAIASLMRQAWDKMCEKRGFVRFELANRASCWFLKHGFEVANRVRYEDFKGVERHKLLVGRSPRRKVYWHFSIEARPNPSDGSFRIIPHVVFSEDGITPFPAPERQHALRRGFCRNWWNARWRDLLTAALSHLAGGSNELALPVSKNAAIKVSARLTNHILNVAEGDTLAEESRTVARLQEPKVAVGFGQTTDYPKEGLLLFGPAEFSRNPKHVRAGVIGTPEGVELFRSWSEQFNRFQADPQGGKNSISFPGFEAVFGARWEVRPAHAIALSRTDLLNAILLHDRHLAIFKSTGMYVEQIVKSVQQDDIDVDIWFVVIPDEIYQYGRPASRVPRSIAIATPNAMGRRAASKFLGAFPSLFPEDNNEALIYQHHLDFHHQLKARLLGLRAVTQVLRESSLATVMTTAETHSRKLVLSGETEGPTADDDEAAVEALDTDLYPRGAESQPMSEADDLGRYAPTYRQMQDRASFAWNLSTTTFFKAGGRPWHVADARPGVCYIGLIFRKDPNDRSRQSCCGAQMFLQGSEGLVFKGAMGPWYSPDTGQFHISRTEAKRLVGTVLKSYSDEHPTPPRELFIHGRTRLNDEEWQGFSDAVDQTRTRLTSVRITRTNEFKLYSGGDHAVRRGTAMRLSNRVGLLWTSGYVDRLGTYPGRETPNPLRIEIVRDTERQASIDTVMKDIFMLTKMNFNSCIYGDGVPVTMRFADAIGDVLMAAKDKSVPPLPFRYYI